MSLKPELSQRDSSPGHDNASLSPADELLAWYDAHRRDLPWRAPPGARASPYAVWLSEMMLQQTTVATVRDYYARFLARWPDLPALAAASLDEVLREWAGLGYYARARNLHKCAERVMKDHGGVFPADETALRALPGIGPYTAAAISAIAFDRPAAVMDGNIERVMARLFNEHTPLPKAKPLLMTHVKALTPQERPGDYAQASMDLGAMICKPRAPDCGVCPWRARCAGRKAGMAAQLPFKTPKKPKPLRYGAAYVLQRSDGAVLLRRRPEKGLLGGMMEPPVSEWGEARAPFEPPIQADWADKGVVKHVFTHFALELRVFHARIYDPPQGYYAPLAALYDEALPTIMRKALKLALET